jgi:hypothetical protein
MGQQPNIELDRSDLPRSVPVPEAPRRWSPARPGEIGGPEEMPRDPMHFGRPGPDTGWALRLIGRADFDRSRRADEIEAVLATLVGARASMYGRAPVPEDVEVGLLVLGLRPEGLDARVVGRLAEIREGALDHAAHEKSRGAALLAAVPRDIIAGKPAAMRSWLSGGGLPHLEH